MSELIIPGQPADGGDKTHAPIHEWDVYITTALMPKLLLPAGLDEMKIRRIRDGKQTRKITKGKIVALYVRSDKNLIAAMLAYQQGLGQGFQVTHPMEIDLQFRDMIERSVKQETACCRILLLDSPVPVDPQKKTLLIEISCGTTQFQANQFAIEQHWWILESVPVKQAVEQSSDG